MFFIAGVDSFGGITDFKIDAAFHAGFAFENRNANFFRNAGINGGFKDDDASFAETAPDYFARALDGTQVRRMVVVDRRRDGDDEETRAFKIFFVRRKFDRRLFDSLVADFMRRIDSRFVERDFLRVEVKTNDVYFFANATAIGIPT